MLLYVSSKKQSPLSRFLGQSFKEKVLAFAGNGRPCHGRAHQKEVGKHSRHGAWKSGLRGGDSRRIDKDLVIDYDGKQFRQLEDVRVGDCQAFRDKDIVTWINVNGLHETTVIERLGACFDLHPQLFKDVLSTGQRPNLEDLGERIFVVMKMHYNWTAPLKVDT